MEASARTMMRRSTHAFLWLLLAVHLGGCSSGTPPILSCEPGAGITPDCRFQNPEDLVPSPAGGFILVSQYANLDLGRPGSLVAFAPASGTIVPLFPAPDRLQPTEGWGETNCPAPDPQVFAPHGIDSARLVTGEDVLYVVNHGGRESVEMFEVQEGGGNIGLLWRGCVLAPKDGNFNDLVVLQSGEFRVSQMYPRDANTIWAGLRMLLTSYTPGFVYHWSPASGFEHLPGSEAKLANGVEQSPDERYLFVNSYLGDEVIKIDTETGTRVGSVTVARPDNLSWSPTGELLVASHHASTREILACGNLETGSCGYRFQIVAVDTDALTSRVLIDHEGPPMGAATVARPFGDSVYLGTFAGDRIARLDATVLAPPAKH